RRRCREIGRLRRCPFRRRSRKSGALRLCRRRRSRGSERRAPASWSRRRGDGSGSPSGEGMIQHPSFRVEAWSLHETSLSLDVLAQTESLFALSNGHLGIRGNLEEGEPHGLPGTYLNGFYELRPLPSAESQYGAPESSQTLIDVTNGKLIRLLVDDQPFDVRYGRLLAHDRVLDFRAGTLKRCAEWCSPARRTIRVTSTRFVSFTHRAILGILYEVEPIDGSANVVVQSELVANEALPQVAGDPRTATTLAPPLLSYHHLPLHHPAL